MKYTLLLVSLSLIFIVSCKVKQPIASTTTPNQLATQKLGGEIDSFPNSSGKLILFVQKKNEQYPARVVQAIVIESSTLKIIAEEVFVPGYIKWVDEYILEMLNIPGTIRTNEDLTNYTRKINLNSQKP